MIKSVFIVMALAAMQPKYTNQSAWKMIREGQSEQQVIQCLGDPTDKESTSKVAIWYYQETPTRENGKVVNRPKFGTVVFRAEKPGQFAVEKFVEPDWTKIEQPKTPIVQPVPQAPVPQMPTPQPVAPVQPVKPVV
jgi:SmpA / OmlA family.